MRIDEITNTDGLDEGVKDYLSNFAIGTVAAGAALTTTLPPLSEPSAHVRAELSAPVEEKEAKEAKFSKEATVLALTIWGEARSHGPEGMRAVGHVILNRMHNKRNFGDTIQEVAWKRKAFSCWNPSDPNRQAMREIAKLPKDGLEYKRWEQAKKIAVKLIAGGYNDDPTKGSLFYHTDYVEPYWAKDVKPVAQVANHFFYREDGKAKPKPTQS